MSFLSKIVSPALHEAAVRAGVRTALVTIAPSLVLPAATVGVISGEWLVSLLIGLAMAAVTAFVAGLQSYASFIAKGIPDPYVVAALEQVNVGVQRVGDPANSERGPPASSALSDAPIE